MSPASYKKSHYRKYNFNPFLSPIHVFSSYKCKPCTCSADTKHKLNYLQRRSIVLWDGVVRVPYFKIIRIDVHGHLYYIRGSARVGTFGRDYPRLPRGDNVICEFFATVSTVVIVRVHFCGLLSIWGGWWSEKSRKSSANWIGARTCGECVHVSGRECKHVNSRIFKK